MKEEVKNTTNEENVNKSLEKKLKKWKKDTQMNGTLRKLKERRYYTKPGAARREEKKENIKNSRKRQRNR